MEHSARALEPALPEVVTAALRRVCSLVERQGEGWRVADSSVGPDAAALAEGLYGYWYTRSEDGGGAEAGAGADASAEPDPSLRRQSLWTAFRAAHAGAARVSAGWTVMAAGRDGAISAAKDGEVRVLRAGEYRMPLRPGAPPAPGEPVEPLARRDHLDAERATWWAFSATEPEAPKGRLYLDPRPASAPRVIREVTAALEPLDYQLKCPVLAVACERVDTIVVYHRRAAREQALGALLDRWERLGPLLEPAVPSLTCPVRPGLAWADDVGQERSYGESRCHALAAAIAAAPQVWSGGAPERRLELLLAGLREAGIDPSRPWEEPE